MQTLVALPTPLSQTTSQESDTGIIWLKRFIWTYFWLLLFEGALRKWVLPGLANPLLVIRDPVVIAIYLIAITKRIFPGNGFVVLTIVLGIASGLASVLAQAQGGRGNLFITLYGLRTNFLHLPLIFLLPKVFNSADIRKLGKWLLIVAFPTALLVAIQFRSAPDAGVNVGAGGSVGGQIEVGFGKIRPAGTFSYNTGLLAYVVLTSAYILSTQLRKGSSESKLALAALPAIAIIIAISGSRSTLLSVVVILAGVVLICIKQPVFFGKAAKGFVAIAIAYFGLTFWTEFRNGLLVHETRFVAGGGLEHGIVLRFLGDLIAPFRALADTPLLGAGLGLGTNAASGLLTGERAFLLAEGDWERVVRESGPILGFAFIALRIGILVYLGRNALHALQRANPLPALIFCAALPQVLNAQLSVPTTLGFAVFTAGLSLAAAVEVSRETATSKVFPKISGRKPNVGRVRGRSEYAEMLHDH